MDPIELPDDITTLEPEALTALHTSLANRAAELRSQHAEFGTTADLAAAATETASAYATVDAEVQSRAAAVGSLSAIPEATPEPEPTPAVELTAEPPAPVTTPEPAPAAAPATPEPAPAPAAALTSETEVLVPDAVTSPEPTPEPISPAQLAAAAPQGLEPSGSGIPARAAAPGTLTTAMRATRYALGEVQPGADLNHRLDVANAITETKNQMSRSTLAPGTRDFVSIAHADWRRDFEISADAEASFGNMWGAVQSAMPALVASGPCCTPLSPIYDFCRLASPQTPVEDCLPVMGAPRGGIRYLVTPDWRDALAGVGRECCGDNDDPEDSVLKPCVHVECPTVQEATVCAVSQCVEFGNLTYRTFPELVSNFLDDLAVAFAVRKEVGYLDSIHAGSTAVAGITSTYGGLRQFIFNIALAAAGYRSRNKMAPNARLQLLAPSWLKTLLRVDMAMGAYDGLEHTAETDAMLNAILASYSISVCWYTESATGAGMAFDSAQGAGAINDWPNTAVVYLFSPGTFVRMDGGTLDVGIVRDSTLNRRNDLQMFMEEWTGVVKLCPDSVRLTIPALCPNGAGANGVTPFVCT